MISWRKWGRRGALAGGLLMASVAVGGFFLPSSLEVTRERLIPLPAAVLYDRVVRLERWAEWAPWWQREPFLEVQYSGPAAGAGATMSWQSKSQGEGRAKITSVSPDRLVGLALDFGDRGDAVSAVRFEQSPASPGTRVRWTFRSEFGGNTGRRYFGLFLRAWVERDLEVALAGLEESARGTDNNDVRPLMQEPR